MADTYVLQKYLSLKTESFDIEQLNETYLPLMEEICSVPQNDQVQNTFLQNWVTLLIKDFLPACTPRAVYWNAGLTLQKKKLKD